MTLEQKQQIKEQRIRGIQYKDIAAKMGLSCCSVAAYCRRYGITPSLERMRESERICKNCGKPFKQGKTKEKLFCCDTCRYTWHNKQKRINAYEK